MSSSIFTDSTPAATCKFEQCKHILTTFSNRGKKDIMNIMKADSTDFHSCNSFMLTKTSTVFCSSVWKVLKFPNRNLLLLIFHIHYLLG